MRLSRTVNDDAPADPARVAELLAALRAAHPRLDTHRGIERPVATVDVDRRFL